MYCRSDFAIYIEKRKIIEYNLCIKRRSIFLAIIEPQKCLSIGSLHFIARIQIQNIIIIINTHYLNAFRFKNEKCKMNSFLQIGGASKVFMDIWKFVNVSYMQHKNRRLYSYFNYSYDPLQPANIKSLMIVKFKERPI